VSEVPGGVAVFDPRYAASHEHNQLIIDHTPAPGQLATLADKALGHLPTAGSPSSTMRTTGRAPDTPAAGFTPIGRSHVFTRTEAIALTNEPLPGAALSLG
jgi:hypothetical protein